MAGFFNAVSACLVLLLLMAVGYFMGTAGWMAAGEKKFLSKYIINIAVPANCIVGLLNNLDREMLAEAGWMLLGAVLGVSATLLLGVALATLLRLPRNQWARPLSSACPEAAGASLWLWPGCPTRCLSASPSALSFLERQQCPSSWSTT